MLEYLTSDFAVKALIAGLGVAVPAAVVGCLLVWRRITFFSDALGHTAVLGVALGALFQANLYLFIIITCSAIAVLLAPISKRSQLSADVWLTIISYGALALGMIIVSKITWMRIDPEAILFGDILGVDHHDILVVYGVAIVLICILVRYWRPLLQLTVDEDLAATAGVKVTKVKAAFLLAVALITAVGLKTVGALMLPGIMIIPAVTARRFSQSPEQMIVIAILLAMLSVIGGIALSFNYDLMTGPSIVVTALGLLLITRMVKAK